MRSVTSDCCRCIALCVCVASVLWSRFPILPTWHDTAAAFREVPDRRAPPDSHRRVAANALVSSGAQPQPSRISLEIQAQQFEFWSPCFEGHRDRRLPSLTWSRLPLPKRFNRGLIEVRISRGRDHLDVRNVSLRIERQPETACSRLSR